MLKLALFGEFSIQAGDISITEDEKSAPRVFRALLYLFANRNKRIALRDFAAFLREGKAYAATTCYSAGSDSLVKTTLHRIRTLLAPLQEKDPACRILCRDGGIRFDPDLVIISDTDRFDALLTELQKAENGKSIREENPERALFLFRSFFALYRGKYLASLSGESWVIPEAKRYHDSYLALCEEYFPFLFHLGLLDELIDMTSRSIAIDPYCEDLHYWKIRAFAEKGEKALAFMMYESLEKLFDTHFHISPSARLRRLKESLTLSPMAASCEEAFTSLLDKRENTPLSSEAFAAVLSFVAKSETAIKYTFVLLTLKEKAEQEALLPLWEAFAAPNEICCRHSEMQYAFLLKNERQAIFKDKLEDEKIAFSLETHPLSCTF